MSLYEKKPTYQDLRATVGRGETVLHGGQAITKQEDLPTALDLAGDDIQKKQQALGELESQRAALDAEIARAKAASGAQNDGAASGGGQAESTNQPSGFEAELASVVGPRAAASLVKAGYDSADKLTHTPDEKLDETDDVGTATIEKLRAKYPYQPPNG